MKKAVSARCTLVGGLLLTFAISAMTVTPAGSQGTPTASASAVGVPASLPTPVKKGKLDEALTQGDQCVKGAKFEQAVEWYRSALKLEPANDAIFQKLTNATRLRDQQAKELGRIPSSPRDRQKFLDKSLEQADRDFTAKQFAKAYKEYNAIWIVAGDYNGKVVPRMEEAGKLIEQPSPASAAALPAAPAALPSTPMVVQAKPTEAPAAKPAESLAKLETALAAAAEKKPEAKATPLPQPSLDQAQAQARAKIQSIFEPDDAAAGKSATPPAAPAPAAVAAAAPAAAPVPDAAPLPAPPAAPLPEVTPVPAAGAKAAPAALAQIPPIEPVGYEQPATGAPKTMLTAAVAAPSAAANVDDLTRLQVTQLLHSARELNAVGKVEEARRNATKALQLWPSNPDAQQLVAELNKQLGTSSRDLLDTSLAAGDALAAEGKFDQALARYDEALKLDPASTEAAARKDKVARLQAAAGNGSRALANEVALKGRSLDQMHTMALKAYEAKDIRQAREIWQRILTEDPTNKPAQVYLENTKAEWDRYSADRAARDNAEKLSEQAQKLLSSPVSVSTEARIPLDEFMKILSYSTPAEMDFYITEGAKAMVAGNFQNTPLRDVLDTVLAPIGLSWSVNEKNKIVIEQKLVPKTYSLSPAQMSKVKTLHASGELQRNIWGSTEPPSQGCAIVLDERQNIMMVTGSSLHIQRIESLLPTLKEAETQELVMRIYKINEKDGPKIKPLINSLISASQGASPFDLERKIFIDKDDLIVRDTPENIQKIEELLLDKKFIQAMHDDKLDIANFSLIPRDTETVSDQIRTFTSRVVEAIRVFLYSQTGESKANEEGRRLWYDPYTLQLTIVDTPTNLGRVGQYIESLPELGNKTRQEVVFLKYAVAEELSASLENILAITSGQGLGATGGGGTEVAFKLRQGEEKQWRNLRIRVIRVTDPSRQSGRGGGRGGQQQRNQGQVEFEMDNGIQVENRNMQEMTTEYVDDYRITIEDVQAAAGQSGMGSARFRISYLPQTTRNALQQLQNDQGGVGAETTTPEQSLEDTGISINAFGELNAIVLRYTNPELYKNVMDLVAQLDKPTNQVSIETKFVEVNENRAKEFGADFNVTGLGGTNGEHRNLDWNTNRFNTRFAQDADEFRDIFSPPIESVLNADLIKGTTVLNAVIGNQDPLLNFSLRFLEAEGVLNIVNGPRVTSLDGQEAVFRIEMYAPDSRSTQRTQNNMFQLINPLDALTQQRVDLADIDEGGGQQGMVNAVVLRCTPEITSNDSIMLNELSAELIDFEGWLGEVYTPTIQQTAQNQRQNQFFTIVAPPQASVNAGQNMVLKRKRIETNARVNNGGTIILGGWTGERSQDLTSGVPILRNMPYIGKLLFSRAQRTSERTTLLIFLTCYLVE